MSRFFNKTDRIVLSKETEIKQFQYEYDYYVNNNRFPVVLFNKPIINIYKNINLQIVITKKCGYKCGFCIENDDNYHCKEISPLSNLAIVLQQYKEQNIIPHISITGGEPTLFPNRLKKILQLIFDFHLSIVNVNTNGFDLSIMEEFPSIRINLSRHHYIHALNEQIFGKKIVDNILPNRTIMQCVMMKDYISSVQDVKDYMSYYILRGAIGFSFRGMSTLDVNKGYDNEISFSKQQSIDFYSIINQIANDEEFEFIQQKIGDHYWFEIYKYKEKIVRFTYSNFEWLKQIETIERNNNQWFSRVTVVSADGNAYSGWTYDINRLTD